MKRALMGSLCILSVLTFSFYMSGCSSDDSPGVTSTNYSGPGSKWDVTLNSDNTFVITYAESVGSAVAMTVNGTYATTTSGFLKLTVTSATGTDAPSAGDQAYAMNIPGFVTMLKPLDPGSEIIPMLAIGSCPTSAVDFNWTVTSHVEQGTAVDMTTGRDLFGTATFNGSTDLEVTERFDLGNNPLGGNTPMSGTCSNGIINLPDDNVAIWLSPSGAGLVQVVDQNGTPADPSDDRDSVIVAMPQAAITDLSNLDGEYIGIVFNDGSGGDKTSPVWLSFDATGTTEAGGFSDVDAGTKDTGNITLTGMTVDTPSDGFFTATLNDGGPTAPMACQAVVGVNGTSQNLIFCVGTEAGDNTSLYTVLLISQ